MKEIAQAILSVELKDPACWFEDEHYAALQHHVFRGGIWDADFRDKISCIREKPVHALSADEINTYLTFIFCTDRTQEGCVEAHIANGVLQALMKRTLELEECK